MLDVRTAMRRSAQFHAGLPAVTSSGTTLTFSEVWERGVRLANGLIAMGVKPGDRVAVLEDNCIEAADFYCASVIANLVRVPLYRRNSSDAHRHMLTHTQCRIAVVSPEFAHELEGLEADVDGLQVLVRDETYEPWLAAQSAEDPDPAVGLDDVFVIRHSAGTTGRAKGIAYTHRAWMSTTRDWFYMLPPVDRGDSCLHVGPISHGSGYLFLPVWLAGGCNVLAPKFEGASFVQTLRDQKIGYFFAVPTMIADIVKHAKEQPQDLPDLKVVMVSGAPISPKTAVQGHNVFGDRLYQMYGQTEAVPVTFMGPKEWFSDVPGSEPLKAAGRVTAFAELEIRGENNEPLGLGEEGEIAIRCEGQMTGIWDDEELSASRLKDGWVLTGDIGRLDKNGYLYVVDRVDDMVVSGGFNIWPAELELVISLVPGVQEVVVFGIPHEKWGEAPHAVVVSEPGASLESAAIIDACSERLGSYKKPASVSFQSDPLPRSPVGKIQRKVLREVYWAGQERRVAGS